MSEPATRRLADHTSLRLGGPAQAWVRAETEEALVAAVAAADADGTPVLILGGGSNLVVADAGFDGLVVQVATLGVRADSEADPDADAGPQCGGVEVVVAAGESWDALVATAARRGWVGLESLSGIPGSVGATPVQNVGAYGQEVASTIASVRTWDRVERRVRTFANADCGFGYRTSRFKAEPARYLILSVTFQLRQGSLGAPVAYAELARTLGVEVGSRAPIGAVRDAVLSLRAGKAMVLDAGDHDTWSAGSFFTNPVLAASAVPPGAPSWPIGDDGASGAGEGGPSEALVKTSAAWLIEQAGFARGHGGPKVSLSTRHTLALTNRGGATTADLLGLAREVRDGVEQRFGVRLVPEPVLVGCAL